MLEESEEEREKEQDRSEHNDKSGNCDSSSSESCTDSYGKCILLDFSLTVKAATLIFISGRGSAISSAKQGKSGFIKS